MANGIAVGSATVGGVGDAVWVSRTRDEVVLLQILKLMGMAKWELLGGKSV